MEKFTVLQGIVAPLDRSNVDTDAIIPKQFLKSIYRTGYARTFLTNGVIWIKANREWIRPLARSTRISF